MIERDLPLPDGLVAEWTKFLVTDSERPTGEDMYLDIFNHGLLFPLQRSFECAAMIGTARKEIRSIRCVMEIGADKGGGFYHWVKGFPYVHKAIACEYRGVPYIPAFENAFPNVQFLGLPDSSYDSVAVGKVRKFLDGEQLDCLFIDGDKSGTSKDFEAYLPLMRPGGLVFIHDINAEIHARSFFFSLHGRFRLALLLDGREGKAMQESKQAPQSGYEGWLKIWGTTSCGVGVVYTP